MKVSNSHFIVPIEVIKDNRFRRGDILRTLLCLFAHADKDGVATVSRKQVAASLSMQANKVDPILDNLRKMGWYSHKEGKGAYDKPLRYVISIPSADVLKGDEE